MYTEELVEEGIVTEVKNGIATVSVINSDSCEECSAKIFCHTENNVRNVTAKDPYGVKAGDKVQISIKGRNVVAASFLLYGLPIIILVAVILIGSTILKNNSELYSSLVGIAVVGIYFFIIHLISNSKGRKNKFLPKIIFVSKEKSNLSL
ncbi:MAG: SoxR reducing system RseC family protein [Ignavibacteriales bacterium]|nr:SoxR reducing system RseC family protein [Ignavibacteriales bacterium]